MPKRTKVQPSVIEDTEGFVSPSVAAAEEGRTIQFTMEPDHVAASDPNPPEDAE